MGEVGVKCQVKSLKNNVSSFATSANNPALYQLASASSPYAAFHDVTSGDNLYYPATAAWDYATGWGSFDAYNLARDLSLRTLPPPVAQSLIRLRAVPPPPPTAH